MMSETNFKQQTLGEELKDPGSPHSPNETGALPPENTVPQEDHSMYLDGSRSAGSSSYASSSSSGNSNGARKVTAARKSINKEVGKPVNKKEIVKSFMTFWLEYYHVFIKTDEAINSKEPLLFPATQAFLRSHGDYLIKMDWVRACAAFFETLFNDGELERHERSTLFLYLAQLKIKQMEEASVKDGNANTCTPPGQKGSCSEETEKKDANSK